MSASRIAVRGIRAQGRHGADPGERDRPQLIEIDVLLDADLDAARRSDALGDTIDYAHVHALVLETVARTSFALLERLGQEILDELLRDPRALRAEVCLAKPGRLDGATPSVTVAGPRTETR